MKGADNGFNIMALPDQEAAKLPFCGCPKGQAIKGLYTKRVADHLRFVQETQARSEANRQKRQEQTISCKIPDRYASATLLDFARYTTDPEKKPAYESASTLVKNGGWIMNGYNMRKYGLTIIGSFGTGKTFLASATYNALIKAGRSGAWVGYPEFVHLAQAGYKDRVHDMLAILRSVDVLLLDDLGRSEYEEPTSYIADVVKDVIGVRYNDNRLTLITTNLEPAQIAKKFGEDTFQRIGELTKMIRLGGKMMRDLR